LRAALSENLAHQAYDYFLAVNCSVCEQAALLQKNAGIRMARSRNLENNMRE